MGIVCVFLFIECSITTNYYTSSNTGSSATMQPPAITPPTTQAATPATPATTSNNSTNYTGSYSSNTSSTSSYSSNTSIAHYISQSQYASQLLPPIPVLLPYPMLFVRPNETKTVQDDHPGSEDRHRIFRSICRSIAIFRPNLLDLYFS